MYTFLFCGNLFLQISEHNQSKNPRILARDRRILPVKITEGLYIEAQIKGTSMNDKNEFGRGSLVRIQATRA